MCNAVAFRVGSDKIEENNCSDETYPNIVMTDSNIESITSLYLDTKNISNITGIEYFTSLTELYLDDNQITDITPLSNLVNLTSLDLRENQISDLAPLSKLERLEDLGIGCNRLFDITPILSLEIRQIPFFNICQNLSPMNPSTDTTSDINYTLPSLFLFMNATLDTTSAADWVTNSQEMIRQALDAGMIKFELQNADMNEDGKSVTILDTNEPAVINVYLYEGEEEMLFAQLTVTYEDPVDPDDPTDPTNDPAVPDTGKNTRESSAAALTATLCILSGIILTAIPMARLYYKNKKLNNKI